MTKQINTKQIRELIEYGFDLELIAFELKVPMEEIRKYKEEIEERNRSIGEEQKIERVLPDDYNRIKQMRLKYNKLFFRGHPTEKEMPTRKLSEKEHKIIDKIIIFTEKKCEEIKKCMSLNEKRDKADEVLSILKKIKGYPLSIEQSKKLYQLISGEELKGLKRNYGDTIDSDIENIKKMCMNCLVREVTAKIDEMETIEELKDLDKIITPEMKKKYYMIIGGAQNRISQKIARIQEKQAVDRINNISPSIIAIIENLANGEIDIEKSKHMIDQEVKEKIEKNPKSKFAVTEEQQRNLIKIQIRKALIDRANEFPIKEPQTTIYQLEQLCGGNIEVYINTVVENFLNRKEFEGAINICNQFLPKGNDMKVMQYARDLKRKVRIAQFSDFALAGIRMKLPFEEQSSFLQLLEYGLKKENIEPEEIFLGKSKDGVKRITLEDVWPEEKLREK